MATAVITGASGGIGLEMAREFARAGYDVALVARNRRALDEVSRELGERHRIRAWPIVADLADPQAPAAVMAALNEVGADPEVLVNNAGFGLNGSFAESPPERNAEMIQVNVTTLTALTRLLLPCMLSRRMGRILNVASTAAFQPGPLMSVYYATKAYVLSFSLALAVELRGTGVTVTALCPGPTRTGFQAVAGMEGTWLARDLAVMDAAAVARAGYRGLRRGDAIVIPGFLNKMLAAATRWIPRLLAARIAEWSQQRRRAEPAMRDG